MTSAFPVPAPSGEPPADARRVPRDEFFTSGSNPPPRRTWQLVAVRVKGRWELGLLREWRWVPANGAGYWAANVQWAPDFTGGWGWIKYTEETVRPLTLAEPTGDG